MCIVCSSEERFMLGDLGPLVIMGYISQTEGETLTVPYLEMIAIGKDRETNELNPDAMYSHKQILAYCPICGKQLTDDETCEEMIGFYNSLHEERMKIRFGEQNSS